MKLNKKFLKEILKSRNLTALEAYNFNQNKFKNNNNLIYKYIYKDLRLVFKYNLEDFKKLKIKSMKYKNWQLKQYCKNDKNYFRNFILSIIN